MRDLVRRLDEKEKAAKAKHYAFAYRRKEEEKAMAKERRLLQRFPSSRYWAQIASAMVKSLQKEAEAAKERVVRQGA